MSAEVTATFDRIGRSTGQPQAVTVTVADPGNADAIAAKLYSAARKLGRIGSRELDVFVDLDDNTAGLVVGGFRSAGTATLTFAAAGDQR